jgi:hypothetical protein
MATQIQISNRNANNLEVDLIIQLLLDIYKTASESAITFEIGKEGVKTVEEFRAKYKDRIIRALELEQQQRQQQ